MVRKIGLITFLFFLMFFGLFTINTFAEDPKVSDCIEGTAECDDAPEATNSNEDSTEITGNETSNSTFILNFIKMILVLFLILGLIYFLLKFLNKRSKMFNQVKALDNLGGVNVGPNKSVQIIRIGKKFYLIGVGDNVELLQEIQDEDVIKDLMSRKEEQPVNILSSVFQQQAEGNTSNKNEGKSFKNLFSNELDKLKSNRKALINQQKQKDDQDE
ncbi:flagellar protein FliO/FliZ [Ornithinibacillus halophilus]|uniref:Flagellar protein n=1 Tax=Ornithinibacillus halophilus TaxID=930117 RepID=A0A1M5CAR0_9BACI|nr:flagellar biosynthetic protein FliO [Ornithinibacillus halophilus]SHF51843.1 flagellar protein FliO/FliZ [Ornithinibacillus halophilus]